MSTKRKSFAGDGKDNPAVMQFLSQTTEEHEEEKRAELKADAPKPVKETEINPKGNSDQEQKKPKTKKKPSFVYDKEKMETKSRRVQILLKPSTYEKARMAAEEAGISLNEYLNWLLDQI